MGGTFLRAGDVVEVEMERIGTIHNVVVVGRAAALITHFGSFTPARRCRKVSDVAK